LSFNNQLHGFALKLFRVAIIRTSRHFDTSVK
jgi:hypothetical protein